MNWRSFGVLAALIAGLLAATSFAWLPPIHDSWLRFPAGNQAHALEYLPQAPMIQAADSCGDGHFEMLERYGYTAQDFQMLVAGPEPAHAGRALLARPEPIAKFFGLAALAAVDSAFAATVSVPSLDTAISVAEGCRVTERPFDVLVAEVRRGYWTRELLKHRIDIH